VICDQIAEPAIFTNKPNCNGNLVAQCQVQRVSRTKDARLYPFHEGARILVSCIESECPETYDSGVEDVRRVYVTRSWHNWLASWSKKPSIEPWIGGKVVDAWSSRASQVLKANGLYFDAILSKGVQSVNNAIFRGIVVGQTEVDSEVTPGFGGGSSFLGGNPLHRFESPPDNPIWHRWHDAEINCTATRELNKLFGLDFDHGIHASCLH